MELKFKVGSRVKVVQSHPQLDSSKVYKVTNAYQPSPFYAPYYVLRDEEGNYITIGSGLNCLRAV